ncbi:hypothetical protein [Ralstonia pseudosolanacearum]|uniref:hypothetical protein n=1 Tax=Ralstonia pseudosolanacearum TaxID=1310165 RepID=UPI0026750516|nr:hypothetical protein [Ralstonia pseudosolanacearum]MDO3524885.1 hypothetical protein [Ralstonia pseudosolanacearum]MDO3549839.1 hypothetical protein [Ralstonia pseudosolanacearum]MDO3554549.1 hypothetical protein [Ralstonia pseudosolanacearum]MDO3569601.1 hypothetical protein [Ralstonia pseudosolanacearum]MDO3584053.1 hypothetical protein [Ralstonia pseudosolanacearum]
MTTTDQIPATRNEGWGFYCTMKERAAEAWPLAMTTVAKATSSSFEAVRLFLDSAFGRHFADDVCNALHGGQTLTDAIDSTAALWMQRKSNGGLSQIYGIPRDLPHLTAFVASCEIADELSA